jgi:hypothetical protein
VNSAARAGRVHIVTSGRAAAAFNTARREMRRGEFDVLMMLSPFI